MADPFAPRPPWRALAALSLGVALFAGVLTWRTVAARMPGERFVGRPPASADERRCATALRRDVEALVAMGERSARRPAALAAARDHLSRRVWELGLEPRLDTYTWEGARYDNVLAGPRRGGPPVSYTHLTLPTTPYV